MKEHVEEAKTLIDELSVEEDLRLIDVYEKSLIIPERLPESIYHYTSPGGLKGIIGDTSLWFTNYRFLNDTSEKVYAYQLLRRCLEEKKESLKSSFYDEVEKAISDDGMSLAFSYEGLFERDDYYLASFSCDKDNLSLWNYYTKNESKTGYSIGFNTEKLRTGLEDKHFNFYEVIYNEEEQKKELMYYIECFNEGWEEQWNQRYLKVLMATFLEVIEFASIRFKHVAFKEEREVRIVYRGDSGFKERIKEKDLLKFREMNGIMVPYLEVTFEKESVEGILISPTQKDELAQEGLLRLLEYKGYEKLSRGNIAMSQIPLRY